MIRTAESVTFTCCPPAPEEHRGALVDEEQDRPVALLRVDADVRSPEARGRQPVDGSGVVALEVVAQLLEVQAPSA